MEKSKSDKDSVEHDFSNPNAATIFPPIEDLNLVNSNPLVYNSDISKQLDQKMENSMVDVLDDFDTKFYSDLSRLSLNDNHTFLNQGLHNNTYKNIDDNAKYVDCNAASSSRVRHSYELNHYSHTIKVLMQRVEEEKFKLAQVQQQYHRLEETMKAMNSSSVRYMQHRYESMGDVNSYCNEEFQNQSLMSRSNGISNNASKNLFNSQSDRLNRFNTSTFSVQVKYTSLDDVEGRIYHMAKDPHGCQFLLRKFTEGSLTDSNMIFGETINHAVELMTDPFGNHLMQKIIEVCCRGQRSQIIHELTKEEGSLIEISCNVHGTRPVQKLIETLETNEQIYRIISALDHGTVYLMKNANGSHVVQSCLKHFSHEQNEFIVDAALSRCVEIATNSHGCCVLQKCITSFNVCQRTRLITQISQYILPLAQDRFGNYVLQCLLELGIPWVTGSVLAKLKGKYAYLLMNKHSSYVVEKCIECVEDGHMAEIIQEIMDSPLFLCLLKDEFGNFAIQRALERTKGTLRASLMAAIEYFAPELQSHPYGKNVLLCVRNGSSRSRSSFRYNCS